MNAATEVFWQLAEELQTMDPRITEGTIMGGRCLRVNGQFLALAGYKDAGMVVKLPRERVASLIAADEGRPFAPAGRVFREWVSIPIVDAGRWLALLKEGVAFVG